jgi:SAM-dependent methyltransferase
MHFTPLDVARHAASLLAPEPGMSVLDVGAGAGKFCLAAALAVPTATFVGVEMRGHLVRLATRLASQLQLQNVRFVHADALDLDWSQFDAFYLYNPFAEQLFETAFVLDQSIKLDPVNFGRYVTAVRQRLAQARMGTRLVTYHGFGAPPPLGYDLDRLEPAGSDRVELWIKTRRGRSRMKSSSIDTVLEVRLRHDRALHDAVADAVARCATATGMANTASP